MASTIYKSMGVFFYFLAGFGMFSLLMAIQNGTATSITEFFKMLTMPSVMMENMHGAISLSISALMPILLLWLFYFLGKFFFRKSKATSKDEEPNT